MPLDLLKKFALKLDFDDIERYCRTSKRFQQVCQDPYFWKDLYERDFPPFSGKKTEDSPVEDYHGRYLFRRGVETYYQGLLTEIDQMGEPFNAEEWFREDAVLRDLNRQQRELQRQIDLRKKEIRDIIAEYEYRGNRLKTEGLRMINNTYRTREPRYFTIADDNALDNALSGDIESLWDLIAELMYDGFEYDLREGDLIGIAGEETPNNPRVMYYIYRIPIGRLAISSGDANSIVPHELRVLSPEDLEEKYNLPFKLQPWS